jgi:hypothetical protein
MLYVFVMVTDCRVSDRKIERGQLRQVRDGHFFDEKRQLRPHRSDKRIFLVHVNLGRSALLKVSVFTG